MTVTDKIHRVFTCICNPSSSISPDATEPLESKRPNPNAADFDDGYSHILCKNCEKLDIRAMLEEETSEEDMGPLSDHLEPGCPFCRLISSAISQAWVEEWGSEELCASSDLVPNVFIQSRSPFTVKENGSTEHPEPRLLLALTISPPGYEENRAVIREIDRVKDRFIISEIERVPLPGERQSSWIPRRNVGKNIDVELVKTWLDACQDHRHTRDAQGRMDYKLFRTREGFRLIDVVDECLVLRTEPCDYAALSYTWGRLPTIIHPGDGGDVPVLLTIKDNLAQLSAPGGLSVARLQETNLARLPRTVMDAINFAKDTGMRHLWVDTLCIVQDDKEDKSILIQAMDDIYDNTAVTYIAAAGYSADAGLRGVGVSSRQGLPIDPFVVVDEGDLHRLSLCPPPLAEHVRVSTWNTRGWTFQEASLSQRCLYFTADEIFFNCQELQFREAYAMEPNTNPDMRVKIRTGPPWWNSKLREDLDATPYRYFGDLTGTLTFEDYQSAVQEYSRKKLSFPKDVLFAFEGIFNRFSKSDEASELDLDVTQGIPVHMLHRILLWFPTYGAVERQCDEVRFSSWSWASWDGTIEFIFADSMWLSRNISQAGLKKSRIHSLVPYWYCGSIKNKFWSHKAWEVAIRGSKGAKHQRIQEWATIELAAKEVVIDTSRLMDSAASDGDMALATGDLGFSAAYIDAADLSLVSWDGLVAKIDIQGHQGEFRFDLVNTEVVRYVAVVVCDTITNPPDKIVVLLGVAEDGRTNDGGEMRLRRMGVGYVYLSLEEGVEAMPWKYGNFRIA